MQFDELGVACVCTTAEDRVVCQEFRCAPHLAMCSRCDGDVSDRPHAGYRCDACLRTVGDANGEVFEREPTTTEAQQ
jgi:hypothetical protein